MPSGLKQTLTMAYQDAYSIQLSVLPLRKHFVLSIDIHNHRSMFDMVRTTGLGYCPNYTVVIKLRAVPQVSTDSSGQIIAILIIPFTIPPTRLSPFLHHSLILNKQTVTYRFLTLGPSFVCYIHTCSIISDILIPILVFLTPILVFLIWLPRSSWRYMVLLPWLHRGCWLCKAKLHKTSPIFLHLCSDIVI